MADEVNDERGELGRRESAGDAARQDPRRADSDRGYGARDGAPQDPNDRGRPDRPESGDMPNQYSGMGGSRTDDFGQDGDRAAGWRAVGDAGDAERIGGEDERPGDSSPQTGAKPG